MSESLNSPSKIEPVRANPSIWRLARWLYSNIGGYWDQLESFENCPEVHCNVMYDKALELYNKLGIASTLGLEE